MTKTKGRILVIRGGDLSEFVLTCPVFAALREQFPETSIEILGYPRTVALAKAAGLVDEVKSIESRAVAGFFARNAALDEEFAEYFAGFSIIFSYLYDPDGFFQANVARVSTAQFIAGPARPKEGESIHATDAFLKPLEKVAIFGADPSPRLKLETNEGAPVGAWIAMNLGREDAAKNWPLAKWRSLAETILAKTAYNILFIASETDRRAFEKFIQLLPTNRVAASNEATLAELAGRLGNCQAFIGPDSGILQLAAATGIPCVAIWGNSNAAIWKPPGKNVTVLKNRFGVNAITQDEALAALPIVWAGAE